MGRKSLEGAEKELALRCHIWYANGVRRMRYGRRACEHGDMLSGMRTGALPVAHSERFGLGVGRDGLLHEPDPSCLEHTR